MDGSQAAAQAHTRQSNTTPENPTSPSPRAYVIASLVGLAAGFVLGGYEFLRTPTNVLYMAAYGKENLPMVLAITPLSVAAATYLYAVLLSWLGPRRTLLVTTLGSALFIGLCQWVYESGFTAAIVPLYLFRSAYVVLLIEQYWSYLNSTLKPSEARLLNGPICGVASLGAIAAGIVGANLTHDLGTSKMVLFAAALTLPAALLTDRAYRVSGEPAQTPTLPSAPPRRHLALDLFFKERRLALLLALIMMTQVLSAVLMLAFQGELVGAFRGTEDQSVYSYTFYAWINGIAAILQFVVAPLLLRFLDPVAINRMIPLLHIAACGLYLYEPGITTAAIAYAGFKCIDYSIFRAAKEMLYLPLSFDARYRAKEVIDVIGYRVSKGLTSGAIVILQRFGLVLGEFSYGMAGMIAAGVWAALTVPLAARPSQEDSRKESA